MPSTEALKVLLMKWFMSVNAVGADGKYQQFAQWHR